MPTRLKFGTNSTVRDRLTKFGMALLFLGIVVPACFAPDSITLKVVTAPGSRVALQDPLTFNAGTIKQGLVAMGFTDPTPWQERFTIDNRAKPATLESMTAPTWPLLPGLTTKGMLAAIPFNYYYPNIEEPVIQRQANLRPDLQSSERPKSHEAPEGSRRRSYAWLPHEPFNLEQPQIQRPTYDYSGPPFLFTLPPETLKNPLIANDPKLLSLFVKTNEAGLHNTVRGIDTALSVRRLRPASYWDGIEASNNPRADYQDGSDYEARARRTGRGLLDLRDPSKPPPGPNDPRPSYETRPFYNPAR